MCGGGQLCNAHCQYCKLLGFAVQAQKICPKKEISRTLSESRLTALSLIPSNMLESLKLALGFSAQRLYRVPFLYSLNFD